MLNARTLEPSCGSCSLVTAGGVRPGLPNPSTAGHGDSLVQAWQQPLHDGDMPTFRGPGSDLKLTTTSPFFTLKHCTTPDMSPTATFCVLFSPGGSTCVRQCGSLSGAIHVLPLPATQRSWTAVVLLTHQQRALSSGTCLQQVQAMQFKIHDCRLGLNEFTLCTTDCSVQQIQPGSSPWGARQQQSYHMHMQPYPPQQIGYLAIILCY